MTKWLGKLVGKVVDMALQASLLAQGSVRGENGIPRAGSLRAKFRARKTSTIFTLKYSSHGGMYVGH